MIVRSCTSFVTIVALPPCIHYSQELLRTLVANVQQAVDKQQWHSDDVLNSSAVWFWCNEVMKATSIDTPTSDEVQSTGQRNVLENCTVFLCRLLCEHNVFSVLPKFVGFLEEMEKNKVVLPPAAILLGRLAKHSLDATVALDPLFLRVGGITRFGLYFPLGLFVVAWNNSTIRLPICYHYFTTVSSQLRFLSKPGGAPDTLPCLLMSYAFPEHVAHCKATQKAKQSNTNQSITTSGDSRMSRCM